MNNSLQFLERLSAITPLSAALRDLLAESIRYEEYKAHQVLYATGQSDLKIAFIQNGLARNYYFDHEGNEHTTRFWEKGQIIFSFEGFRRKQAVEYLEVLEASTLLTITYVQVNELLVQFKEMGKIVEFVDQQYREEELFRDRLLAMPAEERYRQFRTRNPQIFRRLPLRFIASYLNISRGGLSRIMSRG
jgi:CRP-like cAMP-binding protein